MVKNMKTQSRDPNKPLSSRLQKFLKDDPHSIFEKYGFSKYVQDSCKFNIKRQRFDIESYSKYIWFSTEICQPFLYMNDDILDIAGVMDYDEITQTGTFNHKTCDGKLTIHNVHSYYVFSHVYEKYLPTHSRYLSERQELQDVYVAAIVKQRDEFQLLIYHNTNLIYSHDNVFESLYIFFGENTAYKSRLSYVRFASYGKGRYLNYIFDISKETCISMDNSIDSPSWYIDYRKFSPPSWDRFKGTLVNDLMIKIRLHLDNSKTSQIVSEYIKNADGYEVIPNIFDDDDTINIQVTYDNKPEKVRFLYYCADIYPDIFGSSILGMSMDDCEKGTLNHEYEYKNMLRLSSNEMNFYKSINYDLYQKCNEPMKINQLPDAIYKNNITGHDMIVYMYQYLRDNFEGRYEVPWILNFMGKHNFSFDEEKKVYDEIFSAIAKKGKLKSRWKNEYSLYQLILKTFGDAIYQYHAQWLGRQSLDIYIPSQKIAFEYQGFQHYEVVEFYGGQKGLEMRKSLDERKRKLCQENQVVLIEWRYDEPISKKMLENKLALLHT